MNRIEKKFSKLKESGQKALSIFLTAGYPSLAETEKLIYALEKRGVDFFEIGMPFSDPIADGPTIQKSSEFSLSRGTTWDKVLGLCKKVRARSQVPLILMGYSNSFFSRGWKRAVKELARAGFDGAIVPDLLPEESKEIKKIFNQSGLSLICLLAPTSSVHRIKKVFKSSDGFVYAVSVTGVTGARSRLPVREIKFFLNRVRRFATLPVVLGFGISEPQQMKKIKGQADGFVIGSAMIRVLEKNIGSRSLTGPAEKFIKPFVKALRNS